MKRRVAILLAVTAAGGAAGVWVPARVAANTGLCPQPTVTGVSPQVAPAGATVTITGSGFAGVACPVTVNVGGVSGGKATLVNSGTVTFVAGSGLHGGVQVVLTDSLQGQNFSNGNLTFFNPVSASGVSPATPTTGQGVTVGGQGFSLGLPAGDEHVAATYLWGSDGSTCAGASAAVASNTAISVSAPGHYCDGPVLLAITAPSDLNSPNTSPLQLYKDTPGSIDVAASNVQLSSPTATAGGSVTVSGSGFGTNGTANIGSAPAPSTWSDTSVSVSVPDTAVSNSVSLTRIDGAVIDAGALSVVARVDSVSPSSASPGSTVTISGGGFGVHAGTVALGSANMPVSSWSPTSISATVPSGAQTGAMTITPVDTSPPAGQPSLTVEQSIQIGSSGGPGSGGAAGTGGNAHGAASSTPLTPQQVQQVTSALSAPPPALPPPVVGGPIPSLPPSHPTSGPVSISLHTQSGTAAPGKTVPFTVTLRAYGKPVGNAAVQMVIAYKPGPDGSVTPTSGVTDANGQLRGVMHLSKTPGEMIVLARAGVVSDEVRVLGSTATAAKVGGASGAGSTVLHALPIAVIVLAALLLATGIGLRVALAMGSGSGLRAALLRERISAGVRMTWLRRRSRAWRASWHHVQSGADAPAELSVPAEDEPALGLRVLDGQASPEETKEGIEVGA